MIECAEFLHLDELCQANKYLPDGNKDFMVYNCGNCMDENFFSEECFNVFRCSGTQIYLFINIYIWIIVCTTTLQSSSN